jgi:hypothetical protein
VTFASRGDVKEWLESTAASSVVEEDVRGSPGSKKMLRRCARESWRERCRGGAADHLGLTRIWSSTSQ